MKRILVFLLSIFCFAVSAHSGAHISNTSIFPKQYKYSINGNDSSHVGHFYVRKSRVSRSGNEKLKITHTIHQDIDHTRKITVKYDDANSLLAYSVELDFFVYYFNFHLKDGFPDSSNSGTIVIFDKSLKSFSLNNVTLDPLDESVTE